MFQDPKVAAALTAWLTVVFACAALYQGVLLGSHLAAAHSQVAARARIEGRVRWSHGPVYRYSFRFGERALSGESGVSSDEAHTPGELVPVYVDARDPRRNSLVPFAEIASGDVPFLVFCLLVWAAMAWRARQALRKVADAPGAKA